MLVLNYVSEGTQGAGFLWCTLWNIWNMTFLFNVTKLREVLCEKNLKAKGNIWETICQKTKSPTTSWKGQRKLPNPWSFNLEEAVRSALTLWNILVWFMLLLLGLPSKKQMFKKGLILSIPRSALPLSESRADMRWKAFAESFRWDDFRHNFLSYN